MEDTSNFEKTMPPQPFNDGASPEKTEIPIDIHHGEETQQLIQDIQKVQRRSTNGNHLNNSKLSKFAQQQVDSEIDAQGAQIIRGSLDP